MAPTWITIKSYDFTKNALEAWLSWRFAGYEDAVVKVKVTVTSAYELSPNLVKQRPTDQADAQVKDGDFVVYAPEELTTVRNERCYLPP